MAATVGYNLLVHSKENVVNAQSPPSNRSRKGGVPLIKSVALNELSSSPKTPLSPNNLNNSPLRRTKQNSIRSIDGILVKHKLLEEENLSLQKRVLELESENTSLRNHFAITNDKMTQQNIQLQMMNDLLSETVQNLETQSEKLKVTQRQRKQLKSQNSELNSKISRLEEYLELSKTLIGSLQCDKLELVSLLEKHQSSLDELRTSRSIVGDHNLKVVQEINEIKLKNEQILDQLHRISNEAELIEEEMFVNMALSYKLNSMTSQQEYIPILTRTTSDLYLEVKNNKIPKYKWSSFINTALSLDNNDNNQLPTHIEQLVNPEAEPTTMGSVEESRPLPMMNVVNDPPRSHLTVAVASGHAFTRRGFITRALQQVTQKMSIVSVYR